MGETIVKKIIVSASIAILVLLILGCISAPPPETPLVEDPAASADLAAEAREAAADAAVRAREAALAAMKAMDESIAGVEASAEEAMRITSEEDIEGGS